MTVLDQPPEMLLKRVAAGAGEPDHVANRDAAGLASALQDAGGQLRQRGDRELFLFDFGGEAPLLLLKGAQEENQPGLPIGSVGADRALGLPERQVIGFLVVLRSRSRANCRAHRNSRIAATGASLAPG